MSRWLTVTVNAPPDKVEAPLAAAVAELDVEIRLAEVPGGRGTEAGARLRDGSAGPAPVRRLAGEDPRQDVRRALRDMKSLVGKFPLGAVINKGLTVRGAQQHGQRYIPMLLDRLARGELSTSHLVTHELSLEEGAKGYDLFNHKKDGCVRAVFDPSRRRHEPELGAVKLCQDFSPASIGSGPPGGSLGGRAERSWLTVMRGTSGSSCEKRGCRDRDDPGSRLLVVTPELGSRSWRPRHLDLREARLGLQGPLAQTRTPRPQTEVSPPTADECSSTEIERELLRRPERWSGNDIA